MTLTARRRKSGTSMTTIKSFLQGIEGEPISEWPEYFAQNLLTTYGYFITYFI